MDGLHHGLWWLWGSLALVLLILEVLAPGFVFLGFGIGAAAVALLFLVAGPVMGLPMTLVVLAAVALVSWVVLRKFFASPGSDKKIIRHDIND